MVGMSKYTRDNLLAYLTDQATMPTMPTPYLALFTTAPTADDGTGGVEVSGGSYARVATNGDWAAASGTTPVTIANNATISFPAATANWGTVVAFGIYDAATSGNLLFWDYLGNYSWQDCFISSASPGVFSCHAHGFNAADTVVYSTQFGGTVPSFSQSNLTGLLAVVSPSTDTLSVTNGGTAVNTSSSGDGAVRKVAQQVVSSGVTVSFASSALVLSLA